MNIFIPGHLNGSELNQYLYKKSLIGNETEKKFHMIMNKICLIKLKRINNYYEDLNPEIKKEMIDTIEYNNLYESLNITIKSRCLDILSMHTNGLASINFKKEASKSYFQLYKTTNDFYTLYRSVTVRNIKSLNSDSFFDLILNEIPKIKNTYHIESIMEALLRSYHRTKFTSILNFIEECVKDSGNDNNFSDQRRYLNIQKQLAVLSHEEYSFQAALSYEMEADNIKNNEEENTFYPSKKANYQHAYNAIYSIRKKHKLDYNRIVQKLKLSIEEYDSAMTSLPPIKFMEIPSCFSEYLKKKVANCSITSFEDFIVELLNITIYESLIEKYKESFNTNMRFSIFFNNVFLKNGYTEANPTTEEFNLSMAHHSIRLFTLNEINSLFNYYLYSSITVDEVEVYKYLENVSPKYIDEDSLFIWTRGLSHALQNDIVSASYILLPLLERTLRNILEQESGCTRKLQKEIQTSYNLTDILNRLDGIISKPSLDELKTFLNSRCDINFRNELLHGHLVTSKINQYGTYLFWICIKLIHLKGNPPFNLLN